MKFFFKNSHWMIPKCLEIKNKNRNVGNGRYICYPIWLAQKLVPWNAWWDEHLTSSGFGARSFVWSPDHSCNPITSSYNNYFQCRRVAYRRKTYLKIFKYVCIVQQSPSLLVRIVSANSRQSKTVFTTRRAKITQSWNNTLYSILAAVYDSNLDFRVAQFCLSLLLVR